MKTVLQVVENSDRFHASENGIPFKTFFFSNVSSNVKKEDSKSAAISAVMQQAQSRMNEGYVVTLKPSEIK